MIFPKRTFKGYPDFLRSILLDEYGRTVERVLALDVLFGHFTGLQFEKGINVEIFEFWRIKYSIGQITVATLITIGDACGENKTLKSDFNDQINYGQCNKSTILEKCSIRCLLTKHFKVTKSSLSLYTV